MQTALITGRGRRAAAGGGRAPVSYPLSDFGPNIALSALDRVGPRVSD